MERVLVKTLWARMRAARGPVSRRKAIDNFCWLVGEKLVRLVLGAGVGVLVARHLGPDGFGELSYALALAGLLTVIAAGGVDLVLKRDLVRCPEATAEMLATAATLRFGLGLLAYGMLGVAVGGGWIAPGPGHLLLVVGCLAFQPLLILPDLWFQVRLDARRSVLLQLAALAAGSALRLMLVAQDATLIWFAWVMVGEMALGAALLTGGAWPQGFRLRFASGLRSRVAGLWREAWPLLLSGLSVTIYLRVDVIMLKYLVGEREVGLYAAATRISEIGYFVPMALAASLLPALVRAKAGEAGAYRAKIQAYFDLSAGLAYLCLLPLGLLAEPLVRVLYGADYGEAGRILAVHMWAMVFVFLGVARGQWLVNEGLQKFYLLTTLFGAGTNIALNFLLIPRWGGLGAAYATVVAYAVAGWVTTYFHPAARTTAAAQTRALLIPFRVWRYFKRS